MYLRLGQKNLHHLIQTIHFQQIINTVYVLLDPRVYAAICTTISWI